MHALGDVFLSLIVATDEGIESYIEVLYYRSEYHYRPSVSSGNGSHTPIAN